MPKGRYPAQREIPLILEDGGNGLPMLARSHLVLLPAYPTHSSSKIPASLPLG